MISMRRIAITAALFWATAAHAADIAVSSQPLPTPQAMTGKAVNRVYLTRPLARPPTADAQECSDATPCKAGAQVCTGRLTAKDKGKCADLAITPQVETYYMAITSDPASIDIPVCLTDLRGDCQLAGMTRDTGKDAVELLNDANTGDHSSKSLGATVIEAAREAGKLDAGTTASKPTLDVPAAAAEAVVP